MQFIVHLFYLLSRYRFNYMAISIAAMIIFAIVSKENIKKWVTRILVCNVAYSIINIPFGAAIATALLYHTGEKGVAQVTSTYKTSTQYNNHRVIGYKVLLKTKEGETIETGFEDDDFIVYPHHNSVTYPDENVTFTVHYLPQFPRDFVIISNDDSPWASGMNCSKLTTKLYEARARYNFDKTCLKFRKEYIQAINALIKSHCIPDTTNDIKDFKQDIIDINAGK
jgi:hypothetical protein